MNSFKSGDFQKAIREFNLALKKGVRDFGKHEIFTAIGNSYERLELFEQAVIAHKKSIKIKPDYYKAWANLGVTYRRKGDFKDAVSCYKKCLELNPNYAEVYTNLGAIYIFKNKPKKACENLYRAKELDPSIQITYGNLALALAMLGKFDEAEAELKQAIILGNKEWKSIKDRINYLREFPYLNIDPNSFNIFEN
ncbi:MAG: tetratricopeptide repeat protein [Balneola sp.]